MYVIGIYQHHSTMLCTWFLGNISTLAVSEVQATRAPHMRVEIMLTEKEVP